MKRAPHPKGLLPSSFVTPPLAAAVMNGKYVDAVSLDYVKLLQVKILAHDKEKAYGTKRL